MIRRTLLKRAHSWEDNTGNMSYSPSQTSLSCMHGSSTSMNRGNSEKRKESKSGTGSNNKKGGKKRITKIHIGNPENFQHVVHIGHDPVQGAFDVNKGEMDGNWKTLFDLIGVTEDQKQKETMDLISQLLEKRGGVENVTRQIELERKRGPAAPGSQWRLNFDLQQENAELYAELDVRNRYLTESQKEVQKLEQRIKELEEKMNHQTCQNKKSQNEVQNLEQRNKDLEEKMNHQTCQNERYKQKILKLQKEVLEQRKKLNYADELDRYEMGEAPRGICLIINNFNFVGEEQRQGAKPDEEAIARLFNDLHFIVEIRQNLGGVGIQKVAEEMASRDHSKYSAFVFCIMSHGDKKDAIYGVDNRKAGMEDLMSEFTSTNCPSLENKPKLFFIQACRGQRSDPRMRRLLAPADNIAEDIFQIMHSPDADIANGLSAQEADFLLAFATVPGYKAWRSKQAGSWFIQVLVDVIRKYHSRHHLLDMLTEVNKRVADIANEYPDVDLSFQVPSPTHTLRAQVFL